MRSSRRIWLINPFSDLPGEGAVEGRYHTLARMFAEEGHQVTWWTSNFHHRLKAFRSPVEEKLPFEIVQLPAYPYSRNVSLKRLRSHVAYGRAFAAQALNRLANGEVPDHIHLSTPPLDCVAPSMNVRRKSGCRVSVDIMDLWPETFLRLLPGPPIVRSISGHVLFLNFFRLAKRAYTEADGISAVSAEYLQRVEKVAPRQRTHLCYVGGKLGQRPVNLSETKRNNPVTFLYAGALTPTYDLRTVIEAAQILETEGLSFQIKIAGSGSSEASLRAEVQRSGLDDRISFLGFLAEERLAEELAAADVGLNTIGSNAFITMPHKLSDYLCSGLAVANSLQGEAADLLKKHDAGLTYSAGKPASLSGIMRIWIQNPERLFQQRQNAYHLAEQRFDRSQAYEEFKNWILQ